MLGRAYRVRRVIDMGRYSSSQTAGGGRGRGGRAAGGGKLFVLSLFSVLRRRGWFIVFFNTLVLPNLRAL